MAKAKKAASAAATATSAEDALRALNGVLMERLRAMQARAEAAEAAVAARALDGAGDVSFTSVVSDGSVAGETHPRAETVESARKRAPPAGGLVGWLAALWRAVAGWVRAVLWGPAPRGEGVPLLG